MTADKHADDTGRLGAAAAAVAITLAAVLTGISLARSGAMGEPTDVTSGSEAAGTGTETLASAAPPPAHDPLPPGIPVRLRIPAIDVDTDSVIELRRSPSGVTEVPGHARAVGWIEETRTPGERGASVLIGHVRFAYERAVFLRLAELRPGDKVAVGRADGSTAVFTVFGIERLPAESAVAKARAHTRHPDLRLLTAPGHADPGARHPESILVSARLTSKR
ncbi:sortase (surface protein transpeptidase) [Saccharomonospora marina XMU15]|uniref:Sortase (Surface protein transpeptidase) n=1 Tax=Saccharomonospora marina XMU15 TaxID=882083 RepID=H5WZV7_9PSEU|nr:sortase [Saccharomonospora marina]EHR51894.1 sortase (surface protein transpeptidase) [Saccharomonospora marina XMU15]